MIDYDSAVTVLSAMITPAVLISACGSLILTTSQRLSRVIDRTRKVAEQFESLAASPDQAAAKEKRSELFSQLGYVTRRSRLLQSAMTSLYLALSAFVATSAAIGIISFVHRQYTWTPIPLAITGMCLLFFASLLLIAESRLALASVNREMDYVLKTTRLDSSLGTNANSVSPPGGR